MQVRHEIKAPIIKAIYPSRESSVNLVNDLATCKTKLKCKNKTAGSACDVCYEFIPGFLSVMNFYDTGNKAVF